MKTLKEAHEFANKKGEESMFSFHTDPILPFLTYAQLKHLLVEDHDVEEQKKREVKEYNRDNVIANMREYLSFGFEKAYDQRGLSACRAMQKMEVWLFMLDDANLINDDYEDYGLANLKTIDDKYFDGAVHKSWDENYFHGWTPNLRGGRHEKC